MTLRSHRPLGTWPGGCDGSRPDRGEKPPAGAERISRLACLPVFFDLRDQPVLVAGGSNAAAWKAELLAAAGASVDVYAPESHGRCSELLALARKGTIRLHDDHWSSACWSGLILAVGDCETEQEASAFSGRARKAGVPVNVIDKPAYCRFSFGSIVNRSPLVVGISSSGAAPILAQAVRRRIEMLLPSSVGAWATIAQSVRHRVMAILAPGVARRAFWDWLADAAFRQPADETEVDAWLTRTEAPSRGRLTNITVKRGGADRMTVGNVRALLSADIVYYDEGIADEVLGLARREARRVRVPLSEKAHQPAKARAAAIDALVLQGQTVVRLDAAPAADSAKHSAGARGVLRKRPH